MPHIHCYLGQPSLVWAMFMSDLLIGSAYLAISLSLYALVKRLKFQFSEIVFCFGAFILACGATHFMEIWTLWNPDYWVSAWVKIITAAASVGTAIYLHQLRGPIIYVIETAMQAEAQRFKLEQSTLALTARENTLRSFFDSAPMMMGIADVEGEDIRHVSDNHSAVEFFGLSDNEMQGKLASELGVPQEDVKLWVHHYRQAEGQKRPVHFEYTHSTFTLTRQLSVAVSHIGKNSEGHSRFSYIVQDITEMRQAEAELLKSKEVLETMVEARTAELRSSEQKFAKMFEIAPFTFALVKMPEGAIADVNSAWVKLFGYSKQEAIGKTALDLQLYANAEDRNRIYEAFYRHGIVRDIETTIVTKSGANRIVSNNLDLIEIENETYILGTLEDITERKQAQQRLEAQKEQLGTFIKYAPLDVAMLDRDMNYLEVSHQWQQSFSFENPDIRGKNHFTIFPIKSPEWREHHQRALLGSVEVGESSYKDPAGNPRYIRYDIRPWQDENHELGGIIIFSDDITQEKRIKEEIAERQNTLMSVILNCPAVLSLKDREGRYAIANPNYDRILGISAETIIGQSDFDIFPHAVATELQKNDSQVLHCLEGIVIEEIIPSADGAEHLFVSNKFPIFNSKNEAHFVCSISLDITEKRRFEEELKASRAQIEAAFQAMNDGIMIFDVQGKVVLINEAEARICGFPSAHHMRQDLAYFSTVFELCTLDGAHLPIEHWPISRVMRGESLPLIELRGRRVDTGQEWTFAFSGEPVFDDHGKQTLSVIVTRDITSSKRAEEQIRESEERFRTVTNNAASCLFMMNKNGYPTFMNPAAIKVTGYGSLSEIKDRPLHCAVHWKKADSTHYPMEECPIDNAQAELKAVQNQEELFCRKDGSLFPVSYSISPLERNGEVVGSVLEFRDITEEKNAESALRESEARYRVLADTVPHLVYSNNPNGQATYFNYQWMLYTGQSLEWLIEHAFNIVHADDITKLKSSREQAITLGKPVVAEIRLQNADGNFQWHSLKEVPLLNEKSEILAWYGAAVNIEDQKHAQEVLRTAKDELEREVRNRTEQLRISNQELESFSYSVSHDLRAPLRSINGFSKRLMRRLPHLDLAAMDDLERIGAASIRMGQLIDDLLKLSRVSRAEIVFKAVNLSEIAQDVVEELREGDPGRAPIDIRIASDIITYGDANLLRQVLQNLIANAWKFTRHNPNAMIQVNGTQTGSSSFVSVEDNGAGFSMEYAGQLFIPFQRLHTEDEFEGTGIGLATVRRILHKHGGEIWAEAESGKGAKFSFTLPINRVSKI